MSLKSFIKSIRKAKTISDERSVVRKESAAIRTAFRDPQLDQTKRRVNISKLLYLYIMGEKTHFGQVECLKMLSSPRFADKRLGYLATMLFLDEQTEVLTLLTNSLDNDMQHPNAYIVGLALCCLGNVASPELARDLHANVEKILASNNMYLRKKAAIVAARLVDKDADLAEYFAPKISELLNGKALLGACRLIQAVYSASPQHRQGLVKKIPLLVKHLRRVATGGHMPDYDVHGVRDPFLQVELLSTLRTLATDKGGAEYTDEINDILTQVASSVEPGKNAAHAVLYECVKTIFAIDADQSLRVLGVNILGKFLSTKDNNTRYVALDSLLTVINIEPSAVQRHRQTIVGCLGDGDISIRRRALELTFSILNEQNVRVLVREILAFFERSSDADLRPYIASQLTSSAAKYAPNDKWHFDVLVRMLKAAGNSVGVDILSSILGFLVSCTDKELKRHVVGRLVASAHLDRSQHGLALVAVWAVGEYGDLILGDTVEECTLSEKFIVDLLRELVHNATFSEAERTLLVTYVLTAVLKLSVKVHDAQSIEALRRILNDYTYDTNLEVQSRAVEYQAIFSADPKLKRGLLAHMPPPPVHNVSAVSLVQRKEKKKKESKVDDLLDLGEGEAVPTDATKDILSLFSSATVSEPAWKNDVISVRFQNVVLGGGQCSADVVVEAQKQLDHFQILIAVPKSQKLVITSASGDSVGPGRPAKQMLRISGKEGSKVKLRVKVKYGEVEEQFDYAGLGVL